MLTRLVHGGNIEAGNRRARQSREHCEQINLGGEAFRRPELYEGEGIRRAKMSKRKRGDSISVFQKQKQLIPNGGRVVDRLIHVSPMFAQCGRSRDGMPLWCLECGVTIVIT